MNSLSPRRNKGEKEKREWVRHFSRGESGKRGGGGGGGGGGAPTTSSCQEEEEEEETSLRSVGAHCPNSRIRGTNLSAAIGVFSSTRRLSVRLQKFFCIVCGKWYKSRLRPFPSKSSGMVLGSRWLSPGVGRSRAGLSCENCKRCRDRQFFFLPSSPHTNSAAKPCQRPRFLQFLILFCLLPHCQSFV